ncbi:hypothetical protein NEHOM01_1840 [Nematocida homosporus]|uniref:uncharacterized protein n=1 Tax=Nematocida homosporus TaxID=1912981 RepID=UPI00222057C9|nr:uncharacterized protein NEHOM01_1840 [Nematocida homosporus]KAI5186982.1 hypothetical protein NEHOM01_1840 [Nematocida homosporus]
MLDRHTSHAITHPQPIVCPSEDIPIRPDSAKYMPTKLDLTFEKIRFKDVLDNLSDTLQSGQMTAILGPSGAGKTTLLKILAGRKQKSSGQIALNGQELSERMIRKCTAYVHQENHLIDTLTVREMLMYTVRLKAPQEQDPEGLVQALLDTLHLTHAQHVRIGDPINGGAGISGGERKRLSVAQELISMPGILFLDEPTSGLDAHTSESLVLHLKHLANAGLLVAMTIHQPSSDVFGLFDKIILIRSGGIVYSGPMSECLLYLEALGLPCPKYTNPADHLFRVLDRLPLWPGKEHVPALTNESLLASLKLSSLAAVDARSTIQALPNDTPIDLAEQNSDDSTMALRTRLSNTATILNTMSQTLPHHPTAKQNTASFLSSLATTARETQILTSRNFLCAYRNKKYMIAKCGQALFVAAVTGTFLYNIPAQKDYQIETNVNGCFWAVTMGVFGSFSYGAITVLFSDRKIFIKEYGSNYYCFSAYFIAKVMVDFIITCVHPLVAVPIVFACARIGSVFHVFGCVVLGGVGHSLGLLVASAVDTAEIALAIFPAIVYPINLLTGNSIDPETLVPWVRFLQYASPTRHLFNIMFKSYYHNKTNLSPKTLSMLNTFITIEQSLAILIFAYFILIFLAGITLKRKVTRQANGKK